MKSLSIPFSISNGKVLSTADPAKIAEQKIITTLTTSPGERTGDLSFGAGVARMVFEANDPLMMSDYRTDATQELTSKISSINILKLSIEPDRYADNVANVNVVYQLPLSNPQLVTFKVAVPATLTEETII